MATTEAQLITAAGYKILGNETLASTTQPTEAAVIQWLNDGQRELLQRASPALVPGLVKEAALTGSDGSADLPADYFKFIGMYHDTTNDEEFEYAEPTLWPAIKSGSDPRLNTSSYVFTFIDDDIDYFPASITVTEVKLIYFHTPEVIASGGTDAISFPDKLVPLLTDYALAQSKAQDEELQQYQAYMQSWFQRIDLMNQNAISPGSRLGRSR